MTEHSPRCPFCDAPVAPDGWTVIAVPSFHRRPDLDPWDAADVAAKSDALDFVEALPYGASFERVFASSQGFVGDFLLCAALAGYAVLGTEGVQAALLAYHARNLAEARELELEGVVGDALGAVDANAYRGLTALLERLTADAEQRTAELHRSPVDSDTTLDLRLLWERQARTSRERAERALRRSHEIESDREAMTVENEWYRTGDTE